MKTLFNLTELLYIGSLWCDNKYFDKNNYHLNNDLSYYLKVVDFDNNKVSFVYVYKIDNYKSDINKKVYTQDIEEFLNENKIKTFNKYIQMNILKVDIEKHGRTTDKYDFIHNKNKYFIAELNDESFKPLSILYSDLKYFFENDYSNGTYLSFKSLNDKLKNYLNPKKEYVICEYYSNNEYLTVLNNDNIKTIKAKVIKENSLLYPSLKLNDIVEIKYKLYNEDTVLWSLNYWLYVKQYNDIKEKLGIEKAEIFKQQLDSTKVIAKKGSMIGGTLYVKCKDNRVIERINLKEYFEKITE